LLLAVADGLQRTDPLAVPEMREFVLRDLLPGLETGPMLSTESGQPGCIINYGVSSIVYYKSDVTLKL
jgi:hypothetical protein